jgi:hypothetical protein
VLIHHEQGLHSLSIAQSPCSRTDRAPCTEPSPRTNPQSWTVPSSLAKPAPFAGPSLCIVTRALFNRNPELTHAAPQALRMVLIVPVQPTEHLITRLLRWRLHEALEMDLSRRLLDGQRNIQSFLYRRRSSSDQPETGLQCDSDRPLTAHGKSRRRHAGLQPTGPT